MKIHSDILTIGDIRDCVPQGCHLALFTRPGTSDPVWIDECGSRSRVRGFVVRLSGSSKYNMDSRNLYYPEKSATWDEWGIFINNIFKLDPNALVGFYKTYDNFITYTRAERDRCAQYRPDLNRTAPWLDAA